MFKYILAALLLASTTATGYAHEKATYSDNDSHLYSNLVARSAKSKGYSTACYSDGLFIATRKTTLTSGAKMIRFANKADALALIKRLNKKKKATTPKRAKTFRQKARSLRQGIKRCQTGNEGGSFQHSGPAVSSIGTNLDWNDYFSSGIVFCDLFKASRELVPITNDTFNSGTLALRDDGYPTVLPQGATTAMTVLGLGAQGLAMPEGTYTFSFEGSGQIVMSGDGLIDGEQAYNSAGSYEVRYSNSEGGIWFSLVQSSQSDPIRNIRFILPGYNDRCSINPFYTPFLSYLSNFTVVRVMNLMQTNGTSYPCDSNVPVTSTSCSRGWQSRTHTSAQTQGGGRGVALEYLAQLSNAAKIDLWINIPHAATDSYMQNAAELLCQALDTDLRLYVEYSNEVWNSSDEFPQSTWAENMENSLGLAQANDPVAGQRYYSNRAIRMFEIFEEACGGDRIVNVLGGWIGSASMNNLNLQDFNDPSKNPAGVQPEALAVAYYMGVWVVDYLERNGLAATATADDILDLIDQNITDEVVVDDGIEESMVESLQAVAQVASNHSVPLIAYEGGQHLVSQTFENSEQIGSTVISANRNARIYDVYRKMYRSWFNNGGSLFMHFSGVDEYDETTGAFGVKESYDQPLSTAHKFRATLETQSELISR